MASTAVVVSVDVYKSIGAPVDSYTHRQQLHNPPVRGFQSPLGNCQTMHVIPGTAVMPYYFILLDQVYI